jgi:hypothetical protein
VGHLNLAERFGAPREETQMFAKQCIDAFLEIDRRSANGGHRAANVRPYRLSVGTRAEISSWREGYDWTPRSVDKVSGDWDAMGGADLCRYFWAVRELTDGSSVDDVGDANALRRKGERLCHCIWISGWLRVRGNSRR